MDQMGFIPSIIAEVQKWPVVCVDYLNHHRFLLDYKVGSWIKLVFCDYEVMTADARIQKKPTSPIGRVFLRGVLAIELMNL
jgi:hypothetical protein